MLRKYQIILHRFFLIAELLVDKTQHSIALLRIAISYAGIDTDKIRLFNNPTDQYQELIRESSLHILLFQTEPFYTKRLLIRQNKMVMSEISRRPQLNYF